MIASDVTGAARDLYNATGDTFFSDTLMWNWIWQAERIIARKGFIIEGSQTTATVNGTQAYAYPTNATSIVRVTVNGKKLKRVTFRQDDSLTLSNAASIQSGLPLYYSDWNRNIYLRAVPDGAYTMVIYSYNSPAQITSASQSLDIDAEWHMAVVDYILMYMFAKDKDPAMAKFYQERWNMHVIDAIRLRAKRKTSDSFKTVQDEETLPVTILGES